MAFDLDVSEAGALYFLFELSAKRAIAGDLERNLRQLFPGGQQCTQPFVGAQTPYKYGVSSATILRAGVAGKKVGFDRDSYGGQPTANEHAPAILGQRDILIHFPGPSVPEAVKCQHSSGGGGSCARSPITGMLDAIEQASVHAQIAKSVVAIQRRAGAQKPVIVKRLDDGNAGVMASIVSGWRYLRKKVMKVGHLRLIGSQDG